jgi:hypothetical protein
MTSAAESGRLKNVTNIHPVILGMLAECGQTDMMKPTGAFLQGLVVKARTILIHFLYLLYCCHF